MNNVRIIQHSLIFIELDQRSLVPPRSITSHTDWNTGISQVPLPPLHLFEMGIFSDYEIELSLLFYMGCVRVCRQVLIYIDRFEDCFRQFCFSFFVLNCRQNIHVLVFCLLYFDEL